MPLKQLVLTCLAQLFLTCLAGPALAEQVAFFLRDDSSAQAQPLVPIRQPAAQDITTGRAASLFSGQSGTSFFAPAAPKPRDQSQPRSSEPVAALALPRNAGQVERLRHLIAQAEAGRHGYDAVVYAARIKPPKRPTAMTVQEIYDWIAATPGQHHAIGRYQFIPSTLRRLVKKLNVPVTSRFSTQLQDRLANQLLSEAGLHALQRGELSRKGFMNNIARIWAGLPNSTGKSHYAGTAGNKATMSWSRFEREMKAIFPGPA
ncbi:hypothetical protein [Primorskyibacter sp. 2E233]|uniref:hypothetical protein n=1 Tax=Primorskyibacter sp. 2E233 TaxID=3413431 RepID=UPI003BF3170D